MDVRDGKIENNYEIESTTPVKIFTPLTKATTIPPIVILVDDQPAPTNSTVSTKNAKKGRKGKKRLPRSPRRGRPTRKRFRSR